MKSRSLPRATTRRRTLLGGTALAVGAGLVGCSGLLGRPEVRMESGVGVLHPADELHVANGLQPHGDDRVFATVAPDEAPELVGPDANYSIAEALERSAAADQFHAVVQLRSTPEAPMSIRPVGGSGFEWREETLHVTVDVEPWGSLDRIDDDDRREALRSADELVYTSVWDLSPTPDDLPENLTLELATRG